MLAEGVDPNARETPGKLRQTPLHLACARGTLTATRALLAAGANPAALINAGSHDPHRNAAVSVLDGLYRSPATATAHADGAAKMEALISAGLSHHMPTGPGRSVWSDLLAFPHAPICALEPWLLAGADPDELDPEGRSLLLNAVSRQAIEDIEALLRLGANPDLTHEGVGLSSREAAAVYDTPTNARIMALFLAHDERVALSGILEPAPRAPKHSI